MDKKNVLLIGCGYHARRIYVPYLAESRGINLCAIVDLISQKDGIEAYLKKKSLSGIDLCYTDVSDISDDLKDHEIQSLNDLIKKHDLDAVIIATEPLAHFKYAKWALGEGLHVLMDKPITTEVDVSTDVQKAKKLYADYLRLKELYTLAGQGKNIVFTLQAQRRHHKGFKRARDLVIEMAKKTDCPVTSIQAFHSDGQWRFPREILEQSYHPYNQGYGKMSHSGYHNLDTAVWFAQAAMDAIDINKSYNNFEVYAQVTRPVDFFQQLTPRDYLSLFPDIPKESLVSSNDLKAMLLDSSGEHVTGELDAHTLIALRHDDTTITNIGSHAVHNGFSQRNWISAQGRDLYKGNGRVRHESYIIEQGPFQCIIINSYQSQEMMKGSLDKHVVGGEYHYDIHIFRNSTLFPEYKPYELITMEEIDSILDLEYSRGHQENARRDCVDEFIQYMNKNVLPENQESNFLSHELSTQLLSALYQSVGNRTKERVVYGNIY
jgi:predicted dehydrogenase